MSGVCPDLPMVAVAPLAPMEVTVEHECPLPDLPNAGIEHATGDDALPRADSPGRADVGVLDAAALGADERISLRQLSGSGHGVSFVSRLG